MTFGQKIRELRQGKEWSVYDLADAIGKTAGYVSKIEARGEIPSPDMIIKLAVALGVEAEGLADTAKKEKSHEVTENIARRYDEAIRLFRKGRNGKRSV